MTSTVIVIGGGLSGAFLCDELWRRGVRCVLIERGPRLASGASGNRKALFIPYVTREDTALTQLHREGFETSARRFAELTGDPRIEISFHGALHLPSARRIQALIDDPEKRSRFPHVTSVSPGDASDLTGVEVTHSALWYERAGSVNPVGLVSSLVERAGARVLLHREALAIRRYGESFSVLGADGSVIASGDAVVVANAYDCRQFQETAWLPVVRVRGEVVECRSASPLIAGLRTAICYDGYLMPLGGGSFLIGASYDHAFLEPSPSRERVEQMRDRLLRWLPALSPYDLELDSSRVSFRTSTHDRLPYVGQVPLEAEVRERARHGWFGDLVNTQRVPGLYISVGHGSRGLLSTPLAAEILAEMITGSHPTASVAPFLDPARCARRFARDLTR